MLDVIVIGGGITGLAAAYELARRGVRFRLLEADARAGGLVLTEHIDGFTVEAGPDSMLLHKPAAIQLCEELGLGPKLITTTPPRTAYVLYRGRLHALPSPGILGIPTTWKGAALYDLLPWQARARLALEPLVRRPRNDQPDESVAAFFRRRFGHATVDLVAAPLLCGIHAGDVRALSIRSVLPRFAEAEARHGGVIRTFARTRAVPGADGVFKSISSGMAELVSAIERRLPTGSIRYNSPASQLLADRAGWRVFTKGAWTAVAHAVILAVPAYVAAMLLSHVDPEAAELCSQVPYVSTASVTVAWPRAQVAHSLEGSGFVVARTPDAPRITACTWVSSKWAGRAPVGTVLLRAFIGSAVDPDAVDQSDEALIYIVTRELSDVMGISGRPILARVHRWLRAAPQHNVGHLARVACLEERLSHFSGLFVAGSGFRSIGIPDCVADGRAAAAAAAAWARM